MLHDSFTTTEIFRFACALKTTQYNHMQTISTDPDFSILFFISKSKLLCGLNTCRNKT